MSAHRQSRIHVLAGVNGAGKSSIGGAAVRRYGGEYFNPDEAAHALRGKYPALTQSDANSADADPTAGRTPKLKPVLHVAHGRILGPTDLSSTPNWAKPIAAAALKLSRP